MEQVTSGRQPATLLQILRRLLLFSLRQTQFYGEFQISILLTPLVGTLQTSSLGGKS